MLTPVPLALVDKTEPLSPALVAGLLPDGPLEETLAALAADSTVVTTWSSLNIEMNIFFSEELKTIYLKKNLKSLFFPPHPQSNRLRI